MEDSGEHWRLGHRPALDGLRGVAILLVLVAHLAPHAAGLEGAGVVGVTVFFTLSGFLITSLLAGEHQRTGRVSLTGFYRRRAARLLPALYVTLALVLLAQWSGLDMRVTQQMAAAAMLSVSNIWQLAHPGDNGLSHTWSLGIEEQFYLLWPALLLGGLGWRGRGGAWTVGVIALLVSLASMLWSSPAALLWGSLPRATSLLAGCLLAIWLTGRDEGRGRPVLAGCTIAAVLPLVVLWGSAPVWAYILVLPVATTVVLWSVSQGGGAGWLSGSVLRWFGRRSYALYLLHYPVAVLVGRIAAPYPARAGVTVVVSLVLAEASWRFVESPFLARRTRSGDVEPVERERVGGLGEPAPEADAGDRSGVGLRGRLRRPVDAVEAGRGEPAGA